MRHAFGTLLALTALAGCASSSGKTEHARPVSAATEMNASYDSRSGALICVGSARASTLDVQITAGDVVCWLNEHPDHPVQIEVQARIEGGCGATGASGFTLEGPVTLSEPVIIPGTFASLAFPEPGTYPYRIHGLDNKPAEGMINVVAPPAPVPTPTGN